MSPTPGKASNSRRRSELVDADRAADEVVLVLDGPVGAEQEEVVAGFAARGGLPISPSSASKPTKAREALNAGLERCGEPTLPAWTADDLCQPDRLAVQVAYAQRHPDTERNLLWGATSSSKTGRSRAEGRAGGHEAVVRALKWRNVIQSPDRLPQADTLRAVGGYGRSTAYWDYDLFVRLPCTGRFHSSRGARPHPKQHGPEQAARGLRYCANEVRFRAACFRPASSAAANLYWSRYLHSFPPRVGRRSQAPLRPHTNEGYGGRPRRTPIRATPAMMMIGGNKPRCS